MDRSKSEFTPNSKSKGGLIKSKYFKWSLQSRLLLIEAVTMVDGDQASKLRTAENVMQMFCPGTTAEAAAAAVATIPFTQGEKWRDVASRLPSIFEGIDQAKRGSICRSQFQKLQQKLKLMKLHGGNTYRRATNRQRDPIMTSELCRKMTEYITAFRLSRSLSEEKKGSGQQLPLRSDRIGRREPFRLSNDKRAGPDNLSLCNDEEGDGKDFPMSNDKQKRHGKQLRNSCNNQKGSGEPGGEAPPSISNVKETRRGKQLRLCNDQKGRGEHIRLSNDEKLRGRKRRLRLCDDQKGRGSEQFPSSSSQRKRRAEDAASINDQRNEKKLRGEDTPASKSRGERFALSNDERLRVEQIPSRNNQKSRPGESTLNSDERLSREQVPLSNDPAGRGEDSPLSPPLSNDDRGHEEGEAALINKKKGHELEDVAVKRNINKTGQAKDIPSSNDNRPCTVRPELVASQDEEAPEHHGRPQQKQTSPQLSLREAPEARLVKITDYPRDNMFRWSEESRLLVIKEVTKMENQLSKAGQTRSWRHVAECLPKKLFWDVDLDRLAAIAKKQFAEMRRRYLKLKDNENAGGVRTLKFNTMTENIIREMDILEESFVRRPPPAGPLREICGRNHEKVRWVTKKPRLLRIPKAQRGHGAIVVEIFSLSSYGIQDDSSRCFDQELDSYNDATGRNEYNILPHYMESSDYEDSSDCFHKLHRHRKYQKSSDYDYRESAERQTAAPGSYSAEEFDYSEKKYGKNSEHREGYHQRETIASPGNCEADWHSEPYYENEYERNGTKESPCRQQGCSSFISCSDHSLDGNMRKSRDNFLCHTELWVNSSFSHLERRKMHRHTVFRQSAADDSYSHSDENPQTIKEKLNSRFSHLERRKSRTLTMFRQSAADDTSYSHSDENPPNGSRRDDHQSESPHRQAGQAEYDSASTRGGSKSLDDSEAVAHDHSQWTKNSQSEDFVQSDSREPFQSGTREESLKTKSSSAEDNHWDERERRSHQTSRTNHHHRDHHQEGARMNFGQVKNCEAIPSSSRTDSLERDHHQVAEDEADDPPMLDEMLKKVDREFSRLNWWVNHQLFPKGREKITSGIKSANIPDALQKKGLGSAAGKYDQLGNKCRQKRIMWVLKAELQQVRLRLVEEIENSSQVVVQEILQSFKI